MKVVVIGGHSRSVGKTAVAASLISATRERDWTALKLTQFGHGICSSSGSPCSCAVEDPECPYAISPEIDPDGASDTSRLLRAGAREVYWVRAPMGRLSLVLPELDRLLNDRKHVLVESNSILEFWRPDVYVPVLHRGIEDFKESNKRYLERADAFAVVASERGDADWQGVDQQVIERKPNFAVQPPAYCNDELTAFCMRRLEVRP